MRFFHGPTIRWLILLAFVAAPPGSTKAQQKQTPPGQSADVIRVETALVQTDVMVFDKRGKFVDELKRDQFTLKIDGKPRNIEFFEKVQAGSRNEEAQLAAARGTTISGNTTAPVPLDRGRTVFFFIDDLHLSNESMIRTRTLLERFVDREMGQNDQAAVVCATGQIGFLQQLTDNKKVLLKAIGRLQVHPYNNRDLQTPPMSEYQALQIDRNDVDTVDYFVDAVLRENPMLPRAMAEQEVHGRANTLLQYAAATTTNTFHSLKSLIDRSSTGPGRKVLFMVSDGFLLDEKNSDSYARLREVTSAAAASGMVIYSIDARGLTTGMPDIATDTAFDPSGRLARGSGGELTASQDGLNALAADTGGRAFFSSNLLSAAVTTGLKETSVYYLMAWRPETDEQRNPKFRRVEVAVSGRSDLVVRFRRWFGETPLSDTAKSKRKATPEAPKQGDRVRSALASAYPKGELAVSETLNFLNTPQRGDLLVTSISLSTASLQFETQGGVPTANLTLAGVILNDQGTVVDTFGKSLAVRSKSASVTTPGDVYYNNYTAIRPGLYQVRVAAVDEKRGHAGSAFQWIEVPDLSTKSLALSSIVVGERTTEPDTEQASPAEERKADNLFPQVNLNVDHHFTRSSFLRFLMFIYNANSGGSTPASPPVVNNSAASNTSSTKAPTPDLAVQVQVFRDGEPVITDPLHRINTEGIADLARLPYAAELSLNGLPPGRYVLQLTVIDRIARASASQRFNFEVD